MAVSLLAAAEATTRAAELAAAIEQTGEVVAVLAPLGVAGAVTDGVQLHGDIGVSQDYPLHRYFQRAQAARLRLGPLDEQLERIAAALREPHVGPRHAGP